MISLPRSSSEPVLLLSTEALVLFRRGRGGALSGFLFDNDPGGQEQLCRQLAAQLPITLRLLVDIAEEEFRSQELPRLQWADCRRLARKKCRQLFSKASHHHWRWQAPETRGQRRVLCAALCNPPLLQGWLDALRDCGAAVRSISSPALLTTRLPLPAAPALLVLGLHSGGLRASLLVDGQLRLSRLLRMRYGERDIPALCRQLEKMILYLRGQRLLGAGTAPSVCLLAAGALPGQLAAHYRQQEGAPPCRFVEAPADALPEGPLAETRYAEQLAQDPVNHYARREDTRVWRAGQKTRWIHCAGLGLLFAAALYAGHQALAGRILTQHGQAIGKRLPAYSRLDSLARQTLPPLPVTVHVLRDNMQRLAAWRQPGPRGAEILQLLSRALREHGAIRVQTVRWIQQHDPARPDPHDPHDPHDPGRAGAQVVLEAALPDFDGDYQAAMGAVRNFAGRLRRDPASHSVQFLRQPFIAEDKLRGRANDVTRPVQFSLSIQL